VGDRAPHHSPARDNALGLLEAQDFGADPSLEAPGRNGRLESSQPGP
jgi:hypothetical protein